MNSLIAEDKHRSGRLFTPLGAPFSKKEFNIAISQIRKKSSPGLDQISCTMINALPDKYKDLLLNLFNRFLEGVILPSWKVALVIFIPKANNDGLRPISLLSCVVKIFEKISYI